jgi:penicillin-binding protein 1A
MLDHIKSLLKHPIFVRLRAIWQTVSHPVRVVWQKVTAPIVTLMAPLTNWWTGITAPVRTRWADFRNRNPRAGWALGWILTLAKWGFSTILLLVFSVWVGLFGRLPNSSELKNIETANATEIYSIDSVLIGKYYIENRTAIKLENISPYVITALLAIEDKRFFEHSGIDFTSWLRVFKGVAGGDQNLGGGSTLSQQLAKNLYPRKDYTLIPGKFDLLINKIKENIISIRLENIYNKEELLGLYLNTVPFGGDRFGINVASKYFFNKKAKDLNPDQAATLVGMLKATTKLDPTRNPEESQKRRNLVMRQMVRNNDFQFNSAELATVTQMVKTGRLSEEKFNELKEKPVGAKKYGGDGNNDGLGTYFREYLRTDVMPDLLKKLTKEDGTTYNLYRDGLKIYTTLHSKMQQYAEESAQKHMMTLQSQFDKHWKGYKKDRPWGNDTLIEDQVKRSERWAKLMESGLNEKDAMANFSQPTKMTIFSWKGGGMEADTMMSPIDSVRYYFCMLNCGFMALDHNNGYIRAWVGGTNFRHFKYDHILSRRQVGSTFKPIVYAAAVLDSLKPCQYFRNQQVTLVDWTPRNSDDSYGGWYSMIGGLTYSVNVIAAQLIDKVGIQKTIDLAQKMGITSTLPREFGISLGAADIQLYEMIQVYGTIANEGTRPEPVAVLKVTDRNGKVIYDYKAELQKNPKIGPHVQAMTPDQAAIVTRMMESVIDYGTGQKFRRGFGLQGDFAGKTGTTQNQSDGWFINFNPVLVTGAWVGAPSRAVRFRSMSMGQGSAMALPIVAMFWHKVANDRKLSRLLQETFPENPQVQSKCGCPFRISISPDTLNMLLQDSTLRDSLRASGYKNLKQIVRDRYPNSGEEPGGGEAVDPDQYGDEKSAPNDKKEEKKRPLIDRILGRDDKDKDKKDKDKKPNSGGRIN